MNTGEMPGRPCAAVMPSTASGIEYIEQTKADSIAAMQAIAAPQAEA